MKEEFLLACHEITEFCKKHRGKCFESWPDETLFFYVVSHALCGYIFIVRFNDNIKTIAFVQPMSVEQVKEPFSWRKTTGEALIFWELIGNRSDVGGIYRRACERFPSIKRVFGQRFKGDVLKTFEFPQSTVERFCRV